MNIRLLSAVSMLILSITAVSASAATQKPQWGKVICEPVAQNDAVTFATASPFLDNWDFMHVKNPPYVAPKGTLSCTLPLQVTSDTDSDGHRYYILTVDVQDAPVRPAPCQVTYYDGSHSRRFTAEGAGDGYADLVPGSPDFDVNFFDTNQTRFQDDEFMAINVGREAQVLWAGEIRDDRPHEPIVSRCHIEL